MVSTLIVTVGSIAWEGKDCMGGDHEVHRVCWTSIHLSSVISQDVQPAIRLKEWIASNF